MHGLECGLGSTLGGIKFRLFSRHVGYSRGWGGQGLGLSEIVTLHFGQEGLGLS